MDLIDRLRWWVFVRVNKARKRMCTGWIALSFVEEHHAWAHWVFSCADDCPLRRNEKHRTASYKRFQKRNKKG